MADKLKKDDLHKDECDEKKKSSLRTKVRKGAGFDPSRYEFDEHFQPWDGKDLRQIHSTPQLLQALREGKCEVEGRVLAFKGKEGGYRKISNRKEFLECWDANKSRKFREAADCFSFDDGSTFGSSLYGKESIPLLGGPFYKQQYYYDYIRGHNLAFYALHHDPVACEIVNITRDFTLGRGFRVDCKDKKALALWRAFEEVNDLQQMMDYSALELSGYGELMIWWLPNHQTKIEYQLRDGQEAPKGLIPRVRLQDPSGCWEIVTFPEDITRVLYYQMVYPTQWETYTGTDAGKPVPGTKFIYQQIPANEIQHVKINCMSNEKRGRSDLFPVLGYLKRLRDAVDYALVAQQKQSSWAIDTSIDGAPEDIDAYITDLQNLGSIPDAGSEFVHSKKVTRQFLAANAGSSSQSAIFEWCWSMIAAGSGIPVHYFGTHFANATTKASALTATEPVARKFQMRQAVYERVLKAMASRLFKKFGMEAEIEVTFPELMVQDRSAKLKDLALGQVEQWWSAQTAATIAGKEMGISEYEYKEEMEKVQAEKNAGLDSPLTTAPASIAGPAGSLSKPAPSAPAEQHGVSGQDRKDFSNAQRSGNA